MIIRRYLVKETLKTQGAILFILLLIFFSQKLIRILSSAIEGNIPRDLIMPLLVLGISNMADLILPLSLFLGILVTFGRLYSDSEMVAMQACGVKKNLTYQVVFFLCILTCALTSINCLWFGPWSSLKQDQLIENAKINPSLAGLLAGQFQQTPDGNSVIYINSVNNNALDKVFIAQINPKNNQRPSIIIANKGKTGHDDDGNQIITLEDANRYEGTAQLKDFRISNFHNYLGIIKPKELDSIDDEKTDVQQLSLTNLIQTKTLKAEAEFYWRLTLIISVPLMAFLVIPLSVSNPRQGRLAQILPALLLYLIYFLLASSIKANAGKGRLDPALWFYIINLIYFIIALFLNCWDNLFMRKLRLKYIAS
ncbi:MULTISPECIES: LPS export ABC transporter permease LptF [unclassified Gilliamella]|uniref:LPS export ABC transporter permease LptF n=1 Tax=unclassified Gilliamella TaxID=2685620 RepID=UPI00226A0850|nr:MULTISPECIES: LPS export ABC transporter permease LptF [unclassified Gilliamella]MCX8641766.1 LPS export ABC transporter permease LptF [Gilliamella sp. B3835]MCX8706566.1 LPS export ABC transporter permease LptF [Gilliamella sp. B3783]MCX8708965.1 LPS export ABC transporter permease LptF [Gilliamella sp. B3780]MCX8714463.1 LPS export ABC transporter permease LptF [Gilliamella sp. B3781]MCX8715830.1 LPS export ABC transporter permease LptF [Gilliamella sp. B3784]